MITIHATISLMGKKKQMVVIVCIPRRRAAKVVTMRINMLMVVVSDKVWARSRLQCTQIGSPPLIGGHYMVIKVPLLPAELGVSPEVLLGVVVPCGHEMPLLEPDAPGLGGLCFKDGLDVVLGVLGTHPSGQLLGRLPEDVVKKAGIHLLILGKDPEALVSLAIAKVFGELAGVVVVIVK